MLRCRAVDIKIACDLILFIGTDLVKGEMWFNVLQESRVPYRVNTPDL